MAASIKDRKLTVMIEQNLEEELMKHCAATGETKSDAVRRMLVEGLFARNESVYAGQCRRAVRDELNAWREATNIEHEYSADDFYDRLSAATSSEMRDLLSMMGAAVFLLATETSTVCADRYEKDGFVYSRDDWFAEAMRVGPLVSSGMTLEGAVTFANSTVVEDESKEGDDE